MNHTVLKILFVGDLTPHFRSFQRKRALAELGHQVTAISWVLLGPGAERPSLLARLGWKLGLPPDTTGANEALLRAVVSDPPDVLWVEKGSTIRPGTLHAVRRSSPRTRLVSYTEDDMYARHNRSWYYTRSLGLFDVVFTTKSYNCDPGELPALGAKRVVFVDKAYDVHAHRPVEVTPAQIAALGADVGFIGSYEEERAESIAYLAEHGVPVRVWGPGRWHRLAGRSPNLRVEGRSLLGDEYAQGLCATRINLCFLRKINRDLQTDRTMEIPACAAFMLAERTPEHLRLFEEGTEAAYFRSNEELLEKVRYYLGHEDERLAVAAAGHRRCLDSGYSHHERLKYMLGVVMGADKPVG